MLCIVPGLEQMAWQPIRTALVFFCVEKQKTKISALRALLYMFQNSSSSALELNRETTTQRKNSEILLNRTSFTNSFYNSYICFRERNGTRNIKRCRVF